MRFLQLGASLLALSLGCEGAPREAPVERSPVPATHEVEEVEEIKEFELPPSAPSPESLEPTPSTPTSDDFDAKTTTSATVRIVAIHREHWTACGVIHSVGAIEVEVLDVGEPRPRMILFVSCPVDGGHRELLEDGAVLRATLFAKRQRWPTPPASRKLPAELPRRYVKTLDRV